MSIIVPKEFNPQGRRNLVELFDAATQEHSELSAFSCLDQCLGYDELRRHSYALAAFLQNTPGIGRGDRIAIQLPNCNQYIVAVWGVICAGLIAVNVNPLYTERELSHQLHSAGVKALIGLQEVLPTALKVCAELDIGTVISCSLKNFSEPIAAEAQQPEGLDESVVPFARALNEGAAQQYSRPAIDISDVAVLQYTGGTTGTPKGAMLSNSNLISHVGQTRVADADAMIAGDVVVLPLPLYHVYGLMAGAFCSVANGAHTLLIPNPRDIDALVTTLKHYSFNIFVGINSLYTALLAHENIAEVNFSAVKRCYSGGTALLSDISRRWHELSGSDIYEGYGMTEATSVISASSPQHRRVGLAGKPLPGTEVRIVDDQGNSMAPGKAGELWVRGPQVMTGYWQQAEETALCLSADGWLHTGDIVALEEDGLLRIVDRKKDMIIVSGFNVYPNEIEDVITQHPSILEAGAVAIEDSKSGEAVKVVVVSRAPKPDVEELRDFCGQRLARYKVPKVIQFAEQLPKTNVGKVMRRKLA